MKRIEAVTICVNYSDFLEHTIEFNKPHFDQWVIVTTHADKRTQQLCKKHSLQCEKVEDFTSGGAEFNKGRAIARGIAQLSNEDWIVHIDADVILPNHFKKALEAAQVDDDIQSIYGCDRLEVVGWDAWQALLRSRYLLNQHTNHNHVAMHPNSAHHFKVGARWADWQFGYAPIGFFQMWNGKGDIGYEIAGIHSRRYPTRHNGAERTDVQMALKWDRNKRVLIPEFVAIHLSTRPSVHSIGPNWKGRTTPHFGPPSHKGK